MYDIYGLRTPLVHLRVQGKVLVAQLLGSDLFLNGLGLGGGAVLVGSANVQRVVAAGTREAGKHIGRKHATDNVAKMSVMCGQSGRDGHGRRVEDNTHGTLLTYGNALVMSTLRSPSTGRIFLSAAAMVTV